MAVGNLTKVCTGCKIEKPVSEFSKTSGRYLYGVKATCKACEAAKARARRAEKPDEVRAYNRDHYATNRDKEQEQRRQRYATAKSRVERKGDA